MLFPFSQWLWDSTLPHKNACRWKLTFLLIERGQHRSVTTHFEVDLLLGANWESSWWDNYSHACVWAAQCPPLMGKHPPGRGQHLLTITPLTNFSSTPKVMWKHQVSSPYTPHPHHKQPRDRSDGRNKKPANFLSRWGNICTQVNLVAKKTPFAADYLVHKALLNKNKKAVF